MSKLFIFAALALAAVLSVSALAVPRSAPPSGWSADYLEDYDVYHNRYLALHCEKYHGKPFFNACCHPMLATENLKDNRPAECDPTAASKPKAFTNVKEADPSTQKDNPPTTPASSDITGGFGTYYTQDGNAGACGERHSDSDLIAAIDVKRYGNPGVKSEYCGKKVKITNTDNNKSVVVTLVDCCMGCLNRDSIDLSVGAFNQIGDPVTGQLPIAWHFV